MKNNTSPLKQQIEEISEERAFQIETRLKYFVNPKPWFLPLKIWEWLLKSLVRVEILDNFTPTSGEGRKK